MKNENINKVLRIAFGVVAVIYIGAIPFFDLPPTEMNPLATIIKAIPVSLLAILAYLNTTGRTQKLLTTALVFSVGGDIALSLFWEGQPPPFVIGLASFLVGHVFYVILFAKDRDFTPGKAAWLAPVIGFSIAMVAFLFPKLPSDLAVPVIVYIGVITTMVSFALIHKKGGMILIAGALLFMFSDSVIAFNTFVFEEPKLAAFITIMITYYGGQYLIADAFIRQEKTAH